MEEHGDPFDQGVQAHLNREGAGQLSTLPHVTHGRTPPNCKTMFCCIFIIVFLLHVQAASADKELSCAEGKSLSKFRDCECGEYAVIIADNEVEELRDAGVMLHTRRHGPKPKTQYYVCTQCTMCGDGILVEEQCAQRSDTVCSTHACADPTWVYDFGSKACRPVSSRARTKRLPTVRVPATRVPTLGTPPQGTVGDTQEDGSHFEIWKSTWLRSTYQDIIIGLISVAVILLLLVVLMIIMVTTIKMVAHLKSGALSGTPYSSQNTSNSSVNV